MYPQANLIKSILKWDLTSLTLVVAMVFLSKKQAAFHDKWTQTNLLLTGDKINYLLIIWKFDLGFEHRQFNIWKCHFFTINSITPKKYRVNSFFKLNSDSSLTLYNKFWPTDWNINWWANILKVHNFIVITNNHSKVWQSCPIYNFLITMRNKLKL